MSGTTTPNLGLFNTNMLTDGDDYFDFDRDLNGNNNILDAAIGKLSTLTTEEKTSLVAAINELVAGKSSIDLDNLSAIGQAIMDKKVEVEALLQQNGYAKFTWKENNQISNLILQWGETPTFSLQSNISKVNDVMLPYTVENDIIDIQVTINKANVNWARTQHRGFKINNGKITIGSFCHDNNATDLSLFWLAIGT